jgi:hypothetical protein
MKVLMVVLIVSVGSIGKDISRWETPEELASRLLSSAYPAQDAPAARLAKPQTICSASGDASASGFG